jgi:2'-5' RNA ligase
VIREVTQVLHDVALQDASRQAGTTAVVLELDEVADRRVRQLWNTLDRHGVPSSDTAAHMTEGPHVTLAIVDQTDPAELAGRLRHVLDAAGGLAVSLTALGFFLTERAPAYLAVAPTGGLLALHEAVHDTLGTTGSWPYYRPGSWTPHCTLAMGVRSPSTVAEALGREALPIRAAVRTARVVPLPPAPPEVAPNLLAPGFVCSS